MDKRKRGAVKRGGKTREREREGADRQTDRQTDRKTERERERGGGGTQTDRQTDRDRKTQRFKSLAWPDEAKRVAERERVDPYACLSEDVHPSSSHRNGQSWGTVNYLFLILTVTARKMELFREQR